jgi:hypothetical protein
MKKKKRSYQNRPKRTPQISCLLREEFYRRLNSFHLLIFIYLFFFMFQSSYEYNNDNDDEEEEDNTNSS